jgi:acyl-CoA synthetase (AMP-forming)/AMP-acid ligase II
LPAENAEPTEDVEIAGSIASSARRSPGTAALTDDRGQLSWGELLAQVSSVAAELRSAAAGPGDRVAVIGENAIPTLVTHAAGILAGVSTVATSRQLTAGEMADQFADAGVVAAVTGPGGLTATLEAATKAGVATVVVHSTDAPPGSTPWAAWAESTRELTPDPQRPARPPLVYTSGTTGRARGTEVRWVPVTPSTAQEYAAALASSAAFPPGPHLVVGPLQHNGPLTAVRHLLGGEPVVILGRFDAERVLALIEAHRVTSSVMVPTHFARLLALPEDVRARYDLSSLRSVPHTGAACPADVKRAMIEWFGPVLVESYGGSEVGTVCRITSQEWLDHPGSVGRAVPPFVTTVLDESQRPVPVGEVGVLGFAAPPERGIRYHEDPEKTAKAYLAPGILTLGDVGYVDADGFVFITDRIADMVVSGGVNLYPAESEHVLTAHPAVADAAVIGVPDGDLGEALKALVVLRETNSQSRPTAEELNTFCRESLAAYKCPKSYEFVDELARNAMGKLDKRALRRPFWQSERTISG